MKTSIKQIRETIGGTATPCNDSRANRKEKDSSSFLAAVQPM